MIKKIEDEVERFTPKEGYNVVGEDDFEMPGERLHLLGHFKTREEAEASKKRHEEEMADDGNDMDKVHIYGPSGEEKDDDSEEGDAETDSGEAEGESDESDAD